MPRKLSLILSSIGLAATLVVAPASQALASAALPSDQSIYIIDQAGRGIFEAKDDLSATKLDLQIDPSFTDVQTGAYDPLKKKVYIVDSTTMHLGVVDLLGGPFVDLGEVTFGTDVLEYAYGLVIRADGTGRLLVYDNTESQWGVFDIDLTTGVLSNHGAWVVTYASQDPWGFAVDPLTGKEYMDLGQITSAPYVGGIVEFTSSTGETSNPNVVDVPAVADNGYPLWDGKFDSNGVMWFMLADCCSYEGGGVLYSWKPGDVSATSYGTPLSGSITPSGPVVVGASTDSLKPALPNTGWANEWTLGILGLGIVLVFAGVLIARRSKA